MIFLKIIFMLANSTVPDPNCFILMVFLKDFFEKFDFENNQKTTKSMQNYPACKELNNKCVVIALILLDDIIH